MNTMTDRFGQTLSILCEPKQQSRWMFPVGALKAAAAAGLDNVYFSVQSDGNQLCVGPDTILKQRLQSRNTG